MSQFTNLNPLVRMLDDGRRWRVEEPYSYYLTAPGDDTITVPVGYVTDWSSVPRFLWTFGIDPHGKPARAALIHDFLYSEGGYVPVRADSGGSVYRLFTKLEADRIFLDAMTLLGVHPIKRKLMYAGVRVGGRGRFEEVAKMLKARRMNHGLPFRS